MFKHFRKSRCGKVKGLLSTYVDERLSPKEREQVESHLRECQECQGELDSLRATIGLLHRVPLVAIPRSFAVTEVKSVPHTVVFGALRTATAVVTLLLAFLFVGDMAHFFIPGEGEIPHQAAVPEVMVTPSPSAGDAGKMAATGAEPGESFAVDETPSPGISEQGAAPAESTVAAPPGETMPKEVKQPRWLRPLEFSLLGVVIILGAMTIGLWWRRRSLPQVGRH